MGMVFSESSIEMLGQRRRKSVRDVNARGADLKVGQYTETECHSERGARRYQRCKVGTGIESGTW
jgi:hypothetical protein